MIEFLSLAIAALVVDGLVWGFAGFFVFRVLGGRKRWWIGILATVVLSFAEEAGIVLGLVRLLDLRIGNEAVADQLGTDRLVNLFTFDPLSDVLVTTLAIAVGFMVAGWLDERRARGAGRAPSS